MEGASDATETRSFRQRWGGNKFAVWMLTFLSYAMYHASRKIYSVIKSDLDDDKWFGNESNDTKLGLLDALFLFFYAGGLYFGGFIGDRFDPRYVLTIGMSAVALCVSLFGLCGAWGVHQLSVFAVIWSINGILQSSGWPTNVAVMGSWFSFEERGLFMGIWAGNASFGNILGAGIAAVLSASVGGTAGWQWSMIVAGMSVLATALTIWFFLVPTPKELSIRKHRRSSDDATHATLTSVSSSLPFSAAVDRDALNVGEDSFDGGDVSLLNKDDSADNGTIDTDRGSGNEASIGICEALAIPGVVPYALAYACLKSTNYALFFWLPLYLVDSRGYSSSRADFISMLYDAGQIFGAGIAGYVTDRTGRRSPITFGMMLVATVFLVLLEPDWISSSDGVVMMLLFVTGYFMGGPANLISGCISADLGSHKSLQGTNAMSTVAGIIDGTGSLGAAIVQYFVGFLKDRTTHCVPLSDSADDDDEVCTHWQAIFAMLIACNLLACALISPIVVRELRGPSK
eukprot:g153.t1